jgi:hypothetical protein
VVDRAVELGAAFAMRHRHRDARAGHAAQQNRRRFAHFQQRSARLELLAGLRRNFGQCWRRE